MPDKKNSIVNTRVIVIQKLYGKFFNNDEVLTFPKHRFKKFIKDVVLGTIERDDIIKEELVVLEKNYNLKKLDKIFLVIIKAAIFEFLYKSKTPMKIIIKEYLDASNFFLDSSQIKYLHSIIDKLGKNIRKSYE